MGGGIDGGDGEIGVRPVEVPVAVEPGVGGVAPAGGAVGGVGELILCCVAEVGPAAVWPAGEGHGLILKEEFEGGGGGGLAVSAPGEGAVVCDALGGEVGDLDCTFEGFEVADGNAAGEARGGAGEGAIGDGIGGGTGVGRGEFEGGGDGVIAVGEEDGGAVGGVGGADGIAGAEESGEGLGAGAGIGVGTTGGDVEIGGLQGEGDYCGCGNFHSFR